MAKASEKLFLLYLGALKTRGKTFKVLKTTDGGFAIKNEPNAAPQIAAGHAADNNCQTDQRKHRGVLLKK